jgi:hypothetical protein
MAVSFRVDTANAIVFSEAHGRLTGDDLLDFQKRLREDPDFSGDSRHLLDLRDLDRIDVSMAVIRRLAAGHVFQRGSRQAYVVTSNQAFALARVFRALAAESSGDLEIFRDLEQAREWLGC